MAEQTSKAQGLYDAFLKKKPKATPTTLGGFLGPAPASIKDMFMGMKVKPTMKIPEAAGMSRQLPVQGPNQPAGYQAPVPASPAQQPAPVFGGSAQPVPAQPMVPETPLTQQVPSQWMREDGSIMTPDEIAENIATQMKTSQSGGDIGTYAANQFTEGEKTAEQLANEERQLGNARGDLASGESDPYKIASKSGIAYTPEELKAIENAAAGIYDPALTTAISKREAKETADAEERKWDRELKKLEVQHGYDLEKLAQSFEYDKAIEGMKAAADAAKAAGGGNISPYQDERSIRTVQSIDELYNQVNGWTTGFGSLLKKIPTTDAKNFDAQLQTLKSNIAFGELTAMREASKTGGALGNVSNIELNLLESALAALDSAQSPEQVQAQLLKAKQSINRWRAAQGADVLGVDQGKQGQQQEVIVGDDGVEYILID